jgi:murein tripeptide amidase MpaA
VLTSAALPLLPPDFSRFDALNRFNLLLYPNVNVDGRVLSLTLVPEPATFEIFSLGLIGLGLRRRRTSLRS